MVHSSVLGVKGGWTAGQGLAKLSLQLERWDLWSVARESRKWGPGQCGRGSTFQVRSWRLTWGVFGRGRRASRWWRRGREQSGGTEGERTGDCRVLAGPRLWKASSVRQKGFGWNRTWAPERSTWAPSRKRMKQKREYEAEFSPSSAAGRLWDLDLLLSLFSFLTFKIRIIIVPISSW